MRVFRLVLALLATLALSGAYAFAASETVTAQKLGSGSTPVARCDSTPTAWTYDYTKNADGQVTEVIVDHIGTACQTGQMQVALSGTASATGGPTSITNCDLTKCSVVVAVSPFLYPADISTVNAVVLGP